MDQPLFRVRKQVGGGGLTSADSEILFSFLGKKKKSAS